MSFKTVNYLLFEKQNHELDAELLAEFSPFLVSKSLTFCRGGVFTEFVNNTLNVYGNALPSKEETFKFYDNMIPRQRKTKIDYMKKSKAEKSKEDEQPIPEFYSKREVDMMDELSKYLHERTAPSIN
jgi:hypothetical protein